MDRRRARMFVVATVIGVSSMACGADDGPRIDDIAPASAPVGARVTLSGERLCGARAAVSVEGECDPLPVGTVSFGIDPQVSAGIVSWRDDQIDALVPASVASGDVLVVVTVDGRSSNGISFRVP